MRAARAVSSSKTLLLIIKKSNVLQNQFTNSILLSCCHLIYAAGIKLVTDEQPLLPIVGKSIVACFQLWARKTFRDNNISTWISKHTNKQKCRYFFFQKQVKSTILQKSMLVYFCISSDNSSRVMQKAICTRFTQRSLPTVDYSFVACFRLWAHTRGRRSAIIIFQRGVERCPFLE